jgi:hypothetical protein
MPFVRKEEGWPPPELLPEVQRRLQSLVAQAPSAAGDATLRESPAAGPETATPALTIDVSKIRLFVASPMFAAQASGFYVQSALELYSACKTINLQIHWSFLFNESLITRGRNTLAHQFLKTDCTHLLFLDSDIRWKTPEILRMLAFTEEAPVLCGVYPKKEINWASVHAAVMRGVPAEELKHHTATMVVNLIGYQGTKVVAGDRPAEVLNAGTGCMLIARRVLEAMAPQVDTYVTDTMPIGGGTIQNGEVILEFFKTSIDPETRHLLSEDYHFCHVWRSLGGKIHVAPWVNLGHFGSYLFEGQFLKEEP